MVNSILLFITGLVLFLFGMIKLSELMQQQLSGSIRDYLKISVARPVYGFFMGIVSTLLLQSSSATTLLTMGVVSAGLISFYHSLGIILGADIGTTLTAQLVVWRFTTISPFIILVGGILMFTGKDRLRSYGEAIFYFGLIFFGLNLTSEATAPLKNNQSFIRFFQEAKNPLIGVCIGAVFTGIVQASAIPVGIMVIMGQQGLISIDNAVPVVFGANIGTTVTALLGSLVLNINAKKKCLIPSTIQDNRCGIGTCVFSIFYRPHKKSVIPCLTAGGIQSFYSKSLYCPLVRFLAEALLLYHREDHPWQG